MWSQFVYFSENFDQKDKFIIVAGLFFNEKGSF